MTPEQLGASARRLLDDEFFQYAVKKLEDRYTGEILNSQPIHSAEREQSYRMIQAVRALRAEIESIAVSERVNNFNKGLRSKHN